MFIPISILELTKENPFQKMQLDYLKYLSKASSAFQRMLFPFVVYQYCYTTGPNFEDYANLIVLQHSLYRLYDTLKDLNVRASQIFRGFLN